ncbi:MAG: DUF1800 family protein [Verrucomicrobia bacterium]|nr:DUF1800 family protein [Verrucomicrobiota bacterium]MDE3098313.1 DUF1800 domain-containing protein [Verrucomicrobiota bacterium]
MNRMGFGGPPAEIQRLTALDHEAAISSLLDYERIPDPTPDPSWAYPDPQGIRNFRLSVKAAPKDQAQKLRQAENRVQFQRLQELRGWWLNRMASGPRPFQEKMVLFWHGHFATSYQKVAMVPNPSYLMWRQNELFRRLATGNWLEMLNFVAKDPAMLVWLDQWKSRKPHANENFARECMELFALGIGHYTEKDVTEAARALTGWSYDPVGQIFIYRPIFHDTGAKTVLGLTGNLTGGDFLAQIVRQPQSARFITAKLWNFFAGQMPPAPLNQALAEVFSANGGNFKPFLRVLFRSEEFYSPAIMGNAVKSPVEWLVGTARMLECPLPPPALCANMLRNLGQDLFAPPNVKGWDGGLSWINTNTLLARYNDAAVLVHGAMVPQKMARPRPVDMMTDSEAAAEKAAPRVKVGGVDADKILTAAERADKTALVAALGRRLLQSNLAASQETALRDFLGMRRGISNEEILAAIRLVMATPEYQVV